MRRFFLTILFLVLIISLNRDETWALPNLSDQHLTEAAVEEIVERYLSVAQDPYINCDCAVPTIECEEVCAPREPGEQVGWLCGTPANQAALAIRSATEADAHSWAIAKLIDLHPYPFSKWYSVVNHPDAKPLGSLLLESGL